ncbi:MAG: UDP-N-acetylmuramoyl-L-alanine--D-glutamate ligase [Candidatus Pacebacteria bacterium]|nr:UDP-N-acetylmuramoyl-L-alanine--D-glutamate ligase [Candidatus Paceibacterota bacterium]
MSPSYKSLFVGKRITMMGLGILGRGVGVAQFLARCGAQLLITDLKTKEQLASSLAKLKRYSSITYVLGKHRLSDFRRGDMIIKAAGVPLDSPYIAEAKKHHIPIEMDASLFARHAPEGVTIIGVTGTRGKSTVTHLLFAIFQKALGKKRVFLGGNVRGLATLPLLARVKKGDVVVMELDSWQLQGFGTAKISPRVGVFTNLLVDHQNYYRGSMARYFADKANIYRFQKKEDVIIAGASIAPRIKKDSPKGVLMIISEKDKPILWKSRLLGVHNDFNIALAVAAARALHIPDTITRSVVEKFTGVPGRLEYIGSAKKVLFYNDTTATTPDGALAAVRALGGTYKKRIILLGGGADKQLDYTHYGRVIPDMVKQLILFKGAATDKIISAIGARCPWVVVQSMKEAFTRVRADARAGDVVLLSPGAASFGVFKNEFDRGDQFVRMYKKYRR